jgi:hypothetical protein
LRRGFGPVVWQITDDDDVTVIIICLCEPQPVRMCVNMVVIGVFRESRLCDAEVVRRTPVACLLWKARFKKKKEVRLSWGLLLAT